MVYLLCAKICLRNILAESEKFDETSVALEKKKLIEKKQGKIEELIKK